MERQHTVVRTATYTGEYPEGWVGRDVEKAIEEFLEIGWRCCSSKIILFTSNGKKGAYGSLEFYR